MNNICFSYHHGVTNNQWSLVIIPFLLLVRAVDFDGFWPRRLQSFFWHRDMPSNVQVVHFVCSTCEWLDWKKDASKSVLLVLETLEICRRRVLQNHMAPQASTQGAQQQLSARKWTHRWLRKVLWGGVWLKSEQGAADWETVGIGIISFLGQTHLLQTNQYEQL